MRGYHDMMMDIAVQLIQKWSRLNPDECVEVPEDMTRLTLDTIGLCGFNYRFNSFYREQPHPFISSMVRALSEAMNQLQRLGIQDKLMVKTKRQFKRDIGVMYALVDKIIAERKAHGQQGGDDLLAHMLNGKDPDTGEALDDENIRYQIITFLIAGHETTSGLLSFAVYFLMKNPDKLKKAYEEVDRVLTEPIPSYTQVRGLKYIRMILNEALRLWPTAPAFSLYAKEDTVLAGKYPLSKGDSVNVLIPKLHRDPEVWGDDADEFRPERFADPSQIPFHAYKPFGNGQRACIGQQFALQEATLVLGMVLKHFEIIDHTNYQLKVKEALTLKPEGFTMRVRPREAKAFYSFSVTPTGILAPGAKQAERKMAPTEKQTGQNKAATEKWMEQGTADAEKRTGRKTTPTEKWTEQNSVLAVNQMEQGTASAEKQAEQNTVAEEEQSGPSKAPAEQNTASTVHAHNTPLLVLYGSNMGTAEGIARELADTARYRGFQSVVAPLNERVGKLPKEGAVFIVSASYNGKPPGNAREFVQWLESVEAGGLEGVRYAVFGCGDHNWASTYQHIPRFIDEQLTAKGATRLAIRGEADASGDFEMQVEEWSERLWPEALHGLGMQSSCLPQPERATLSVQVVRGATGTPLAASYDARPASVVENRELQGEGSERSTRHLEIVLPEGVTYQEGDHLGIIPENDPERVERVLRRYGLQQSDHLIIQTGGRSAAHLPLDRPISVYDLLSRTVELQEAVTRAQLRELAACTVCPPHQKELEALLQEDAYKEQVLGKRLTMLDLLVKYPACELPFARFIELLPPLKPRYYSISSSPKAQPERASITVAVVRGQARSGGGEYRGVASNYLAKRQSEDPVVMFVSTPDSGFQLPENPETPVIMVGPGTGIAPFRGFLQARRALKNEGNKLGEAHLFFGCRSEVDQLYREEMEQFEREGIVRNHMAFSRKEGTPKTYVQHLLMKNSRDMIRLLDQGGKLYLCGEGSKMAPDVEIAFRDAYREVHGVSEQEASKWLESLQNEGRYAKDVWAGN
jgi:sulfite reductase alpha subunit-like flavoprotein/cytochrome P450